MIRTIISLDPEDKAWLDRTSRRERVPMTRLVRRAIRRLREEHKADPKGFERLLEQTSGLWGKGDGPAYQRKLRGEWERDK